jgi:hypothetical protein
MRIDYGGEVIPWYESPLAGGFNYTWQERPPEAPPVDKSSWGQGSGGGGIFGGFFENLDDAVNTLPGGWLLPVAVAVTVATGYVDPTLFATEAGTTALAAEGATTLTAAELATLTEASVLADTAMAGAGGVGAGAGTVGATAFTGATETGLGTLAGEGAIGDVAGTTLLGEAGATGAAETAIGSGIGESAVSEPLGTFQMGQGTSLSADASTNPLNPFYNTANPEVSANFNTVSNLVGGGAESNLTALNQLASNPLIPLGGGGIGGAELGSVGSILGSGQGLGQQTLAQVLAPTGLSGVSVQDLASDKSVYSSDTNIKDALRAANALRKLLTPQQQAQKLQQSQRTALQNAQNTQQQSNMANMLRGTQMAQTPLPAIYKQQNPFNFGQQNQPVQDTTALANLLRTA